MINSFRYPNIKLLINNEWVEGEKGNTLDVLNPATEEVLGKVACASTPDLKKAAEASAAGFEVWRATSPWHRRVVMLRAASLLRGRTEHIATLITQEQGKPIAESRSELSAAVDMIEWFAEEATRIYGRVLPSRVPGIQHSVYKEPIGPVAAFTPWNYPVNQIVRKLCAALATGCSIVIKAPEETPASPAALVQAFIDAGIPPGVLGLLFGDPEQISSYLISHPLIRKVTFTGSTCVGKKIAALAGANMKPVTMELGGHAPVIITEGTSVADVINTVGVGAFRNAGQVCISPTRFLVHESLYDETVKALKIYTESLKVGNGLEADTQLGPLANARRITALESCVRDAVSKGARLVTGGSRMGNKGFYFQPTLLRDVPTAAELFNEEPFGPIVGLRSYRSDSEAILEANRLQYGLSAYLFSNSVSQIHAFTSRIESGMIWVNQRAVPFPEIPFGGIKDSGHGCEGGPEALEAYLITKTVSINMN